MKMPKPITTTTKQSFLTKCRYMIADREHVLKDYRALLPNPDEQAVQLLGVTYGALQ